MKSEFRIELDASQINEEEAEALSWRDAKQVLINTFGYTSVCLNDDEDSPPNGWTINLAYGTSEDVIDILIEKASGIHHQCGGSALYELASKAAEATNRPHEKQQYTNLYYYFFTQQDAKLWLEKMLETIIKYEVKEND